MGGSTSRAVVTAAAIVVGLLLLLPAAALFSPVGATLRGPPARPVAYPAPLVPHPFNNSSGGGGAGNNSTAFFGWHPVNVSISSPGLRAWPAMAWDPTYGGIILFGGRTPSVALGDTWLFQDGKWSQPTFTSPWAPAARWGDVLVWDPLTSDLLLFGGRDVGQFYNDTWILNSTGWWPLSPSNAPQERAFSTGYWDPGTSRLLILDGGCATCSTSGWFEYNDSWAFKNGTWSNVTVSQGPLPPRDQITFSGWDPVDAETIMFGGQTVGGMCAEYNTTWTYNGTWRLMHPTTTPGSLVAGASTWDGVDGYFLVYGGQDAVCNPTHATWSYHNGTWTDRTSSLSQGSAGDRCCTAMAYDPIEKLDVLYAGNGVTGYLGDTWTYPVAPLTASIVGLGKSVVGWPAQFTVNQSGGLPGFSYNWSFGDGAPNSTGANATHVYGTAGVYPVHLTLVDSQGRSVNATLLVRVYPVLNESSALSGFEGDAPLTVDFALSGGGGAPPVTYHWDFGDGGTGLARNASHVYTAKGNYTATVTVRDAVGETQNFSVSGRVFGTLTASLTRSASEGLAPFAVNFSVVAAGGERPYSFDWEFGDGATQSTNSTQVNHTYVRAGTFQANVTVRDAAGGTAVYSTSVTVVTPLTALIVATDAAGVAPLVDTFTASMSGGAGVAPPTWNFGDGSPSVSENPVSHEFTSAGTYTVRLHVTDSIGESYNASTVVTVVTPLSTTATSSTVLGMIPLSVDFLLSASGGASPVSVSWSFGDGSLAQGAAVAHTYTIAGAFTVTVLASDPLGESVTQTLHVTTYNPLSVTAVANPSNLTLGATTTLSVTPHGGYGTLTVGWTGLPPGCLSADRAVVSCTPTSAGSYTPTVTLTDSEGDTATSQVTLAVLPSQGTSTNQSTPPGGALAGIPVTWFIVAVGVILGAAIAAVLLLRRPPPSNSRDEEFGERESDVPVEPPPDPPGSEPPSLG